MEFQEIVIRLKRLPDFRGYKENLKILLIKIILNPHVYFSEYAVYFFTKLIF
jgi:hypothetical protein